MTAPKLDIIVPVYNEGQNILPFLAMLNVQVKSPFRVLICYDNEDDTTLAAVENNRSKIQGVETVFVKNRRTGLHGAVTTGFDDATAKFVVVMPSDDFHNAAILDRMVGEGERGADIVCASRFSKHGAMLGCPWIKSILVRCAAFTLYYLARLPTRDATNGFRLFRRSLLAEIPLESNLGGTYSIELLVKCHRLGKLISEVPALWVERQAGTSRFKVFKWMLPYLHWYFYAFATTYLHFGRGSVRQPVSA